MKIRSSHFALITGASSGIGKAIAFELARKEFNLLLVSNQQEELEATKKEILSMHSIQIELICMDLALQNSAEQLYGYVIEQHLEIEILINNAGILLFGEMTQLPFHKIECILNLHIHTPVKLCKLFSEEMMSKQSGYIMNISSISAVMPYPGISFYGPTKTFLRYFSRAIRHELKSHHVSVTCVLPGATQTALYDPNRVNLSLARKLGVMKSADDVAKRAVKAMFRKQPEVIPGIINQLTVWFLPLLPHALIGFIHRKTKLTQLGTQSLS